MKLLSCLLTTLLFVLPVTAQSQDGAGHTEAQRTISVTGEGSFDIIPDMATVRFGIVTRHDNPEVARSENATTSKAAMNAVRKLGVNERKMKLASLRLQPVREYNPETRRNEDKGFEASRDLIVEVEDLDILPALIAQIVDNGANRLSNVTYGLKERDKVRDKALVEAVTRAREKATLMAKTLGANLGMVLKVSEQGFSYPTPIVNMEYAGDMMLAKSAAAPEPEAYAAGEMKVEASVQVIFELK